MSTTASFAKLLDILLKLESEEEAKRQSRVFGKAFDAFRGACWFRYEKAIGAGKPGITDLELTHMVQRLVEVVQMRAVFEDPITRPVAYAQGVAVRSLVNMFPELDKNSLQELAIRSRNAYTEKR